jgi:hypothetical protein
MKKNLNPVSQDTATYNMKKKLYNSLISIKNQTYNLNINKTYKSK